MRLKYLVIIPLLAIFSCNQRGKNSRGEYPPAPDLPTDEGPVVVTPPQTQAVPPVDEPQPDIKELEISKLVAAEALAFQAFKKLPPTTGDGKVCFYKEKDYGGEPTCSSVGDVPSIAAGFEAGTLSVKVAPGVWVEMYNQTDFQGTHFAAGQSLPDLAKLRFTVTRSYRVLNAASRPRWVTLKDNTLIYRTAPNGDRIMDYSTAGYGGGGVKKPILPVVLELELPPMGAASVLQAAINKLASAPADAKGLRGTIKLGPGTWVLDKLITIAASGIVLQGTLGKDGEKLTVFKVQGAPREVITIRSNTRPILKDQPRLITDDYVPSGVNELSLASVEGLKVGDSVFISVPATPEWVAAMGMNMLVRSGKPQTWVNPTTIFKMDRIITAISGNKLTFDAGLPHAIAQTYTRSRGGATVQAYDFPDRVMNSGIEDLAGVGAYVEGDIRVPLWRFLSIDYAQDIWVDNVDMFDFGGGAMTVGKSAKRVTVNQITAGISKKQASSAGGAAILTINGSQVLFSNTKISKSRGAFYFVTQSGVIGPNVILNLTEAPGSTGPIQPHQRWGAGLLADNALLPEGAVEYFNRHVLGSGHGWTMGYSVIWNSMVRGFINSKPPLADNWAIGVVGSSIKPLKSDPYGSVDLLGTMDSDIPSLYLTQLRVRLGSAYEKWR